VKSSNQKLSFESKEKPFLKLENKLHTKLLNMRSQIEENIRELSSEESHDN